MLQQSKAERLLVWRDKFKAEMFYGNVDRLFGQSNSFHEFEITCLTNPAGMLG